MMNKVKGNTMSRAIIVVIDSFGIGYCPDAANFGDVGANTLANLSKVYFDETGKKIALPRKEFELFSLLTSKPGKVFKREVILDTVWGNEVVVGGRTIDVHIRKLREKIGDSCFKTVKGVGYKFQN